MARRNARSGPIPIVFLPSKAEMFRTNAKGGGMSASGRDDTVAEPRGMISKSFVISSMVSASVVDLALHSPVN